MISWQLIQPKIKVLLYESVEDEYNGYTHWGE